MAVFTCAGFSAGDPSPRKFRGRPPAIFSILHPGTIAKVYKQLEEEQPVETPIGAGTRVSPHATAISKDFSRTARKLIDLCKRDNLELSEVLQVIRAT
ncbi:hypothetical protein AB6813_11600 [bacterium RCC_150]